MAVLVCAVASMVLGGMWYGPLFGKKWMEIVGADLSDVECKEIQKAAGPLYFVQFLLTLFQVFVLANFIIALNQFSALEVSLWLWVAFIIPTVAGGAMWNNDSKKIAWARFLIQAGYQLILFILFAIILGSWK